MKRKIITTDDGSSSLYVPELDETYHSTFGAVNEALHVFIKKGLAERKHLNPLRILEVGFGTGLNALLTLQKSMDHGINVHYTGLEKHPITTEELAEINHGKQLNLQSEFKQLHDCPWEVENEINANFSLKKLQFDLIEDELMGQFDLVYFDAFAPNKQSEMWSKEVFEKIFKQMNNKALLVTYCCQGQVKRTLKSVGFTIAKTDGPPGKREMLTATKSIHLPS
ncbi:MAG: tRNA U34 5-methylaminomethyl-2-thiouridine-forming methyltransferase MnmC [Saprospiraceae bacterium]|jgi:tRNA U34 5-methylaminomethyl-2-thiouridine-forming methyltransferase MnmC